LYRARLSARDHCNGPGARLGAASLIVRQDRANVHKGAKDREDEDESLFSEKYERERLAGQIEISPGDQSIIQSQSPAIAVFEDAGGYRLEITDVGARVATCW
jgi:hypothetical protein